MHTKDFNKSWIFTLFKKRIWLSDNSIIYLYSKDVSQLSQRHKITAFGSFLGGRMLGSLCGSLVRDEVPHSTLAWRNEGSIFICFFSFFSCLDIQSKAIILCHGIKLTKYNFHLKCYSLLLLLLPLSYAWLFDSMDSSPPGSSVHGISQARIQDWVAILFSRESSQPRDQIHLFCLAGRFFITGPPGNSV